MSADSVITCPLCTSPTGKPAVKGADARTYYRCESCGLIFVAPGQRLSAAAEREYYGTHRNSIDDEGYVRFLNRIIEPMQKYLEPGMHGLDFGCGPGPTLSVLLGRRGIRCDDYDPLFADIPLHPPYDFIFATECFEHFHRPADEIRRIRELLKPGGLLAVMTQRWCSLEAFATWHYTRDPTHVVFFHERTFDYVCREFGFEKVWQDDSRVVILRRGAD